MSNIHLLIDYYKNSRPERAQELDFCFEQNVNSTEFDHVHIFKFSPLPFIPSSDKVIINECSDRLTYGDYIDYAKENIPEGDIIVLSNSDMFFDETILLTKTIDLSDKVLALTRWCPNAGHWVDEEHNVIPYSTPERSQDVWVWSNPLLKNKDSEDFNIRMGVLGCDNRIAFKFAQLGYQVWNPSYSILCYHNHTERNDEADHTASGSNHKVWLKPPYLFPDACTIENMIPSHFSSYATLYVSNRSEDIKEIEDMESNLNIRNRTIQNQW